MTDQATAELLPCDRSWDALLDRVSRLDDPSGRGAGPDGHERTCPHCQAPLLELDAAWGAVRALADEPVRAPSGLVGRVMEQVREAARQGWHSLLPDERGTTRVAARVIAVLGRLAGLGHVRVNVTVDDVLD